MPKWILVTYASRTGSTAEVAEAIAKTLAEGGEQVDVVPMNEVKDLSLYQSVVVGSAIRGSKWLPEAVRFVQAHQSMLAQKKVAMFTVCITMAMKNAANYRSGVMGWVAPVRLMVKPLSEERGDHRDWDAIRTWAQSLGPILG
jgi:menaquinone-dependent protoporphyrinogen oxidase